MKDILKYTGMGLLIVLVFVALVVIVFVALSPLSALECDNTVSDIGLPHRYLFWGGCQILDDGHWIPIENWRYIGNEIK